MCGAGALARVDSQEHRQIQRRRAWPISPPATERLTGLRGRERPRHTTSATQTPLL